MAKAIRRPDRGTAGQPAAERIAAPAWKLRYAPHLAYPSLDHPMYAASVGSADPIDQIRFFADLGFAGIEDNQLNLRSVADQRRIGRELVRRELEMGCFVNMTEPRNPPLWGSRDRDTRARLLRELRISIETAKRVGGRHLTTSSGRDLRVPLALDLAGMVDNLRELAPIAEQAGVIICLESTSETRVPGRLLHRILDAYGVVKAVNSPAVRLVFDIFHVQVMDGDVINNLARTWDAIAAIQVSDNPGRTEPGTGELNYPNILRFIKQRGYRGLIGLEHVMARPGRSGERQALALLRGIDDAI
ncbi:MAG: hypothetical protein EXQ92_10960 [Alphaproteobacteria bacterium]|nr:hypothetical protein [Alphaproteobacteria bacterium]